MFVGLCYDGTVTCLENIFFFNFCYSKLSDIICHLLSTISKIKGYYVILHLPCLNPCFRDGRFMERHVVNRLNLSYPVLSCPKYSSSGKQIIHWTSLSLFFIYLCCLRCMCSITCRTKGEKTAPLTWRLSARKLPS